MAVRIQVHMHDRLLSTTLTDVNFSRSHVDDIYICREFFWRPGAPETGSRVYEKGQIQLGAIPLR